MIFYAQSKGKMFDKLPKSKTPHDDKEFLVSTKFDGFYTQIGIDTKHKIVRFWTSGGKEFYLGKIADQLLDMFSHEVDNVIRLECEYIYRCTGKLGERVYSARQTTYRTEFEKGTLISQGSHLDVFKVFNIIDVSKNAQERIDYCKILREQESVKIVEHELMTYAEAHIKAKELASKGWEGVMLTDPDEYIEIGKRVNYVIKIKHRPEAIAQVIDELEGEGRLEGTIGSLLCTINGITFKVGSGLDDYMRSLWGTFIGKDIEVEFEQLSADGIPLQPVFKRVVGGQ